MSIKPNQVTPLYRILKRLIGTDPSARADLIDMVHELEMEIFRLEQINKLQKEELISLRASSFSDETNEYFWK